MNKRVGMVIAALVAAVLVVVLAVPYYLGIKAEQSLQDQQAILAKTSFLTIKQHTYERGWFSSTETTVVQFNPRFLADVQQTLPDNVKKVLQQPITLVNHVRHGLFAGSLRPVRAQVDTEFRFTPEVRQILMRFFGQQQPVSMHNTIFLGGSGQISVVVPKFNYEELSGIKMLWQGLQTQIDYVAGYGEYDTHTSNPGLTLVLADKGQIAYQGLSIDTHTIEGRTELALGDSKLNLKNFSLQWHDALNYDVHLNDLINLVTNLQIGAFINPTGSVPPSKIVLHDLYFTTQMQEDGEWINSSGTFGFAKLNYGSDVYGPLSIEASAEHLQAKSLLALKHKLTQLAAQKLSNDALQAAIIQAAKTEGLGLFTHNPVLKLKTFRFQMPEGLVDVHGQMAFKDLTAPDMQQLQTMLGKTDAQFEFAVPQKLLESFAISQARNLFTVDPSAGGPEALADIDETIRLMVDSSIRAMAEEGYVRVHDGIVQSQISLVHSQLTLNGKKLVAEPQEPDYWDESASAPAASAARR